MAGLSIGYASFQAGPISFAGGPKTSIAIPNAKRVTFWKTHTLLIRSFGRHSC